MALDKVNQVFCEMKVTLALLLKTPRTYALVIPFSVLFALSCTFDNLLTGEWGIAYFCIRSLLYAVAAALAGIFALSGIEVLRLQMSGRVPSAPRWNNRRVFWIVFTVLAVVWGFYYLLYFPGCASTDSNDILKMVLGQPFESDHFRYSTLNNHHPLLYTALVALGVQLGVALGSVTLGIGLFTLFQMLLLALACAWALAWLYRRVNSRVVFCVAAVFFIANPLIARYAVTLWKDIPFAGVMLLFSIVVLEVALSRGEILKQKKWLVAFLSLLAGVVLLRSNGILVGLMVVVVLVWYCRPFRKTLLGAATATVVSVLLVQTAVFGVLGVASGHFAESVSLPLQQMARSVVDEGQLTNEQADFINEILPLDALKECYRPDTPNPLKFSPLFNDEFLESHKAEFLGTWISMFPSNAGSYLKAWGEETLSYWNIGASCWYSAEAGYNISEVERENDTFSLMPSLLHEPVSPFYGNTPIQVASALMWPLFNTGFLVWVMLFCLLAHLYYKRWALAIFYVPCVVYWVTFLLAAPITGEFRYMFSLHLLLPFFVALTLFPLRGEMECKQSLPFKKGRGV